MDKVAVIIPAYNHPELLEICLRTLRATTNPEQISLIVIDDAVDQIDTDMFRLLARDFQAIYRRNERNLGFIGSTIAGTELTDDPFILFLNSDISCNKTGWIEAMLANFVDPMVGVVGAKLVFPEGHPAAGKIQHAGVATNAMGGVYHAYYGEPSDLPAANEWREINVVTGGCLMTRRITWQNIGGWDLKLKKGVFEDVDYCRSARKLGWKVVYEPKAELCHFESASAASLAEHPLHSKNQENAEYLSQKWAGAIESDESLFGIAPMVQPEIKLPAALAWMWPIRGLTLVRAVLQAWLTAAPEDKQVVEDEAILLGETYKNGPHVPVMLPAVMQAAKEVDLVSAMLAKGFTTQQTGQIMSILTKNEQFPKTAAPRKRRKSAAKGITA